MTSATYTAGIDYDTRSAKRNAGDFEGSLDGVSRAGDRAQSAVDRAAQSVAAYERTTGAAERSAQRMTRGQRSAQRAFERVASAVDHSQREQIQLERAQRALNRAVRAGVIDQKTYNRTLAQARQHYAAQESSLSRYVGVLRSARGILASGAALGAGAVLGGIARAGDQEQALLSRLEIAFQGSRAAAREALDTARELGSAVGMVEEFANATINLANRGFAPTAEQLQILADTASANGKSLDQYVEAVLDAQQGEAERLKEFGIRMRSEGDEVAITFRGITQRVSKDSNAITEALLNIGRENFAGSLEKQSERLSARWAALKGNANQLGVALDRSTGLSSKVAGFFGAVSSGLGSLTEWLNQGRDLSEMIEDQTEIIRRNKEAIEGRNAALENFGAASAEGKEVQRLTQERARLEETRAALEQRRTSLEAGFGYLDEALQDYGTETLEAVNALLRDNSDALDENYYRLIEARQATALTAAIQRQYGDNLSALTGVKKESNKEDDETVAGSQEVARTLAERTLAEHELERAIQERLNSAARAGATESELHVLEEELRLIARLYDSLDFDPEDENLRKILGHQEETRRLVEQTQALIELRQRGIFVPGLPVPVVLDPPTGGGGKKKGDSVAETVAEDGRRELEQMAVFAGTSLFESLSSAISRAAANGKLSFRDLLDFGISQSGNFATIGALVSTRRADAERQRQAVEQARQTASQVASVASAWFAVYDAIDSWVDRRDWERANRGSVRLEQFINGELSGRIERAGSAVRQLLLDSGDAAASYIDDLLFGLDASLERLGGQDIQLRVENGEYSLLFNSAIREFGTNYQAAFDALIIESLRQAEIDGPDDVQRALRSTRADSLQQLERELAIAQEFADLPLSQTERDLQGVNSALRSMTRSAVEMGLAASTFGNIGRRTVADLVDYRNSITGAGPTDLERRRADALDYNEYIFGDFEDDLRREAQEIHDQLAGLSNILGEDLDVLGNVAAAGFTGVLSEAQGGIDGVVTRLTNGTAQLLNVGAITAAQAEELRNRLLAISEILQAIDSGALSPIDPGEIRATGGGNRRQQRQDFHAELDRLRLAAQDGTTAVALSIYDMRRDLEEEAERLRRLGIAEALIEERIQLEEQLRRQGIIEGAEARVRGLGDESGIAGTIALHRQEREELAALNPTLEDFNRLLALQREELGLLAAQREAERQAAGDLLDGIGQYQRQLLDLEAQYDQLRKDELALAQAREEAGESARDLTQSLGRLDAEQAVLAQNIYRGFLGSLRAAGVEIPGFEAGMIAIEFTLARSELAALAADRAFHELLAGMGTSVDALFAAIDAAEQRAINGIGSSTPAGVRPTDTSARDAEINARNAEIDRVLDLIDSSLRELRDEDPRISEPQRFDQRLAEYEELLARARGGDVEAAEEATRLALELRSAGEGLYGVIAEGRYSALIDRFDADLVELRGIVQDQLSPAEIQREQLTVLHEIRDSIDGLTDALEDDDATEDPVDFTGGRVPVDPGTKPRPPGGKTPPDDFDGGRFRDLERLAFDFGRAANQPVFRQPAPDPLADALKELVTELRRQAPNDTNKAIAQGIGELVTEARQARDREERKDDELRLRIAAVEYGAPSQ